VREGQRILSSLNSSAQRATATGLGTTYGERLTNQAKRYSGERKSRSHPKFPSICFPSRLVASEHRASSPKNTSWLVMIVIDAHDFPELQKIVGVLNTPRVARFAV
jgi:hypothetical protein